MLLKGISYHRLRRKPQTVTVGGAACLFSAQTTMLPKMRHPHKTITPTTANGERRGCDSNIAVVHFTVDSILGTHTKERFGSVYETRRVYEHDPCFCFINTR